MDDVVDLGIELKGWDGVSPGASRPAPEPAPEPPVWTRQDDGGLTAPLRDLQAHGFHRTPPPGFMPHARAQAIRRVFDELFTRPWDLPDDPFDPTPWLTVEPGHGFAPGGRVEPPRGISFSAIDAFNRPVDDTIRAWLANGAGQDG